MSFTRLEIEEECLRILAQRDESVHAVPIPLTTTSLAGDLTSINATPLGRGTGHANRFDGCHVKIAETVASGPTIGEVAAVDDAGFDLVDDLTVSPAFTAAVQSGTDVFIYPKGLAPEYLIERINSVLRHTDVPYIWAPSLVFDSDLNQADLSYWDDILTPTKAISTSFTSPYYQQDFFGANVIEVVANAADEGITSEGIAVDAGESLLLSVYVQVTQYTTTGISVIAYDNSNSQDIKEVSGIENALWNQILTTFIVPSSCKFAKIRFLCKDTGTTFYVAPPVIVQSVNQREYQLPSWFTRESQLQSVVRQRSGQSASQGSDIYIAGSQFEDTELDYSFLRSDVDIAPFKMAFRGLGNEPIFLRVMRPLAELSTDTATTVADKDYVAAKVVANILRDRKDSEWPRWASKAARLASARGYGQRDLTVSESLVAF